jgi:hypothetical protein
VDDRPWLGVLWALEPEDVEPDAPDPLELDPDDPEPDEPEVWPNGSWYC